MFISDLFEHRDDRPTLMSKLLAHSHDENVFVTFVDMLKVGINPQSEWDDPVGVYLYPVREVISGAASNNGHLIPFAQERRYAFLIRSTGNLLELQDYTADDLDRDLEKIAKKFWPLIMNNEMDDDPEEQWEHMLSMWYERWGAQPGEAIWRITDRIANYIELRAPSRSSRMIWHQLFRACGYDGVVDRGDKIISPNEPAQCVIFNMAALTVLEASNNDLRTG
jgi:hypothetical protein